MNAKGIFVVSGQVIENGQPVEGARVMAFHQTIRGRRSLGATSFTDKKGAYELQVPLDTLQAIGTFTPTLVVEAVDALGLSSGISKAAPKATSPARMEQIKLDARKETTKSEYEALTSAIAQALAGVEVGDITDKEVDFLVEISPGAKRDHIVALKLAAKSSRETNLPVALHYALHRSKAPSTKKDLLELSAEEFTKALKEALAAEEKLVPPSYEKRINDFQGIFRRWKEDQELAAEAAMERHSLHGVLLNGDGKPLHGVRIKAFVIHPAKQELGEAVTDGNGSFLIGYKAEPGSAEKKENIELSFSVFPAPALGVGNDPIHEETLTIIAGRAKPVLIKLPQSATQPPDKKALYAALNLPKLAGAKFKSLVGISRTPRLRFAELAKKNTHLKDDLSIHRTWITARSTIPLMESMVVGARVDLASGPTAARSDLYRQVSEHIAGTTGQGCHCHDCEAAVSPAAYLADLLDFTLTHLVKGGLPVNLNALKALLLQPIDQLPALCSATDERVSQARLCIEVLRRAGVALPSSATATYLEAAYSALLEKIGTSYTDLHLAAAGSTETQEALAEQLGIDASHLPAMTFDPTSLTEVDLETIFGLRVTDAADPLAPLAQEPEFLVWRREQMFESWKQQDHPQPWTLVDPQVVNSQNAPPWLKSPPVIDPDLIGPDDFRDPTPKANAADPNKPFDLWLLRRAFVDVQLVAFHAARIGPNPQSPLNRVQPLLDLMKIKVNYDGADHSKPWSSPAKLEDLLKLREGLRSTDDSKAKRRELEDDYKLEPASLERLIELCVKNKEAVANPGDDQLSLTAEEWDEFYSILVQARKRSLSQVWKAEENSAGFEGDHYWIAQREPATGQWPPQQPAAGQPRIDPSLVSLADLPESGVGANAIQFWKDRQQKLLDEREAIKSERELTDFNAMLKYALGAPNSGDAVPHIGQDPNEPFKVLLESLGNNDQQVVQAARQQIEQDLKLTEEGLRRLVAIWAKDSAPNQQPTAVEYEEIYSLLLPAHKQMHLYPIWVPEEVGASLSYWHARKACLPQWRSSAEQRARWQAVLRSYLCPVIIDPDIVFPDEIVDPFIGTRAYDVWSQRDGLITAQHDALEQMSRDNAGYDQRLNDVLGFDHSGLDALDAERKTGANIGPKLSQLNLTAAAFNELLRISKLLAAVAVPTSGDWKSIDNILTAAWKHRQYPAWHQAEADVFIGPQHFHLPEIDPLVFPPPPLPELTEWRAAPARRREWLRTLDDRIELIKSLEVALQNAVSETESATLPQLRDAFLMVTPAINPNENLQTKAKRFSAKHLIETQSSGCVATTRVAQAIESVQGLLFAVRSALYDQGSNFAIDRDIFDQAWPIVGSYETWRANMLVYLYPENLLLPTIRPWRTPAFDDMAKALREAPRLNALEACRIAKDYEAYFKDIASLDIQATCEAMTRINEGVCKTASCQRRALFYIFAQGRETGSVYWSVYDYNKGSEYAQTPWTTVQGIGDVLQIVGAVPYRIADKERYIYLFLRTRERATQKLSYVRYDLESQRWDDQPTELELSIDDEDPVVDFRAVILQRPGHGVGREPHIAVRLHNGAVYDRGLDTDGKDWRGENWRLLVPRHVGEQFNSLKAMIGISRSRFCLIATRGRGIEYCMYGENRDDGQWRILTTTEELSGAEAFRGAFLSPDTKDVFVTFATSETSANTYLTTRRIKWRDDNDVRVVVNSLEDFDDWLKIISGVSLKEVRVGPRTNVVQTIFSYLSPHQDTIQGFFPIDDSGIRSAVENALRWMKDHSPSWIHVNNSVYDYTNPSAFLDEALVVVLKNESLEIKQRTVDQDLGVAKNYLVLSRNPSDIASVVCHVDGANFTDSEGNLSRNHVYLCINHRSSPWVTRVTTNDDAIKRRSGVCIAPRVEDPQSITANLPASQRRNRHDRMKATYQANAGNPKTILEYLDEAYFFAPMQIALQLQARGQYLAALDWYRTLFDYEAPQAERKIFVGLEQEEARDDGAPDHWVLDRGDRWLLDPTNPHGVAVTRFNAYTRFTLMNIVRCLLDFADAEFTRDTAETVARARNLYRKALELLEPEEPRPCEDIFATLDIEVREQIREKNPWLMPWWNSVFAQARQIASQAEAQRFSMAARESLLEPDNLEKSFKLIHKKLNNVLLEQKRAAPKIKDIMDRRASQQDLSERLLDKNVAVNRVIAKFGAAAQASFEMTLTQFAGVPPEELINLDPAWLGGKLQVSLSVPPHPNAGIVIDSPSCVTKLLPSIGTHYIPPLPSFGFCVPPNPVPKYLRLRANLNLYKALNCRNIAGELRELEPYSASTSATSGIPMIGSAGQIVLPGPVRLAPTPYRYVVLIERAKQLVAHAQQIESGLLSALQQQDAETYSLVKARQDVALARAGLKLQDLRVKEAENGVELADLQHERTEISFEYYDELIAHGLLDSETAALNSRYLVAATQALLATAYQGVYAASQGVAVEFLFKSIDSGLSSAQTLIGIYDTRADIERREQDWRFQRSLAQQDLRIGRQQITLAKDRERIVGQERAIADLQTEHAKAVVDFLSTKFTDTELYAWMSNILEGVYRYFLQQATSMAQLAAMQLAFERQKTPFPFILADYWDAPNHSGLSSNNANSPDRHGLTGSARLLWDIDQLDQHAFQTDRPKERQNKIISLWQHFPEAFQRFRESGVLRFETPMRLFDQEIPGDYLRIVKRVRVAVIALVPPTIGIRASLSADTYSRVVIGGDLFQPIRIERGFNRMTITSPIPSQEPEIESPMMQPFEGMGVDTRWEFRMPKAANPIDYTSIADIQIMIDYTALFSAEYYLQVIQQLDRTVSALRPFSLRYQFADAWYDLHNSELIQDAERQMVVSFTTRRDDFPPNISDLKIVHLSLLVAYKGGAESRIGNLSLSLKPQGEAGSVGGAVSLNQNGFVSTSLSNAGNWGTIQSRTPVGEWTLDLRVGGVIDSEIESLFKDDKIEDILFVITFGGVVPEWPSYQF